LRSHYSVPLCNQIWCRMIDGMFTQITFAEHCVNICVMFAECSPECSPNCHLVIIIIIALGNKWTTSCRTGQQLYNWTQSFGTQALSTTKHNTMIRLRHSRMLSEHSWKHSPNVLRTCIQHPRKCFLDVRWTLDFAVFERLVNVLWMLCLRLENVGLIGFATSWVLHLGLRKTHTIPVGLSNNLYFVFTTTNYKLLLKYVSTSRLHQYHMNCLWQGGTHWIK